MIFNPECTRDRLFAELCLYPMGEFTVLARLPVDLGREPPRYKKGHKDKGGRGKEERGREEA